MIITRFPSAERKQRSTLRATFISIAMIALPITHVSAANSDGEQASEPPIIKACATAYAAFQMELSQITERTNDFQIFASKIENYQIRLYSEENDFIVEFSLQPFHGSLPRGGGTKYEIELSGKKILNIKRSR